MPRGKQAKLKALAGPVDTPADSAQQDASAAAIPSEVQGGGMDCDRLDSGAAEPSQSSAPATEPAPEVATEAKRLQEARAQKKKVIHEMLDKSVEYGDYITKQLKIYQDKLESDLKQDIKPDSKRRKAITTRTPTQLLVPLLNAELKDYQIAGVKWLISCWENGVNAILADEMGLGKTIQTLAFLSHLISTGINGPFMVVAPLSTLQNWEAEAKRFLPSQRLMVYHGTIAERKALQVQLKYKGDKPGPDFPIIVTSYEMLTRDRAQLCKVRFKCLIVDEGHRLKNTDCRLVQELRCFEAEFKLLLTGTPIQNNINELWSLLNFIMPVVFYSEEEFVKWFEFTGSVGQDGADKVWIDAEVDSSLLSKLHAILGPFMLRRLKSNVSLNLPLKLEIVLYAPMQPKQHEYTQLLREGKLKDHLTELADEQGCSDKIKPLNNFLMQLRKIANHTYLITNAADPYYPPAEELEKDSGKLALLMRLLNKLRAEGHKVLVFSQMTGMLDIISYVLECKGWKAGRLDGETPWQERQANINEFNTDKEMQVFLVSTRAGGLGINLTAADTVIIYDSDWNPHQDEQAMDRVHRIGQTKPVLVLRLATSHSVDSRMLKRAADKKTLERLVIKKDRFMGNHSDAAAKGVSEAELKELLQGTYQMDDMTQSQAVTDQVLNQLLDRVHLEKRTKLPYPQAGVGYEVVPSHDAKATA